MLIKQKVKLHIQLKHSSPAPSRSNSIRFKDVLPTAAGKKRRKSKKFKIDNFMFGRVDSGVQDSSFRKGGRNLSESPLLRGPKNPAL